MEIPTDIVSSATSLLNSGGGASPSGGGGASGLLKGASGIMSAAGPMGMAAGAGLSLASGLLQNVKANKLKKQADAAMPPMQDPRQMAFLSELNQKRKAIDTGADFASAMDQIDATAAGTRQGILSASGGNTGSAMQGLLASQRGADVGKGNVIAQGQQQQMGHNQMFDALNNKVAARTLQLELLNSQQKRAEWAQKKQTADQNVMAGITSAASILGNIKSNPEAGAAAQPGGSAEGGTFGAETADNVNFDTGGGAPSGSELDTSFLNGIG